MWTKTYQPNIDLMPKCQKAEVNSQPLNINVICYLYDYPLLIIVFLTGVTTINKKIP